MAKDNCGAFSASKLGFKRAASHLPWIMELAFSGRKPHNNCGSYFFTYRLVCNAIMCLSKLPLYY